MARAITPNSTIASGEALILAFLPIAILFSVLDNNRSKESTRSAMVVQ